MSRFFSRLVFFLVLWMLTSGVSMAQVHVLRLNPELLRNARKIERQAINKKDSLLLAEAYFRYGELYQSAANNLASKRYYLKALHLLEPRGDSFELGRILLRVGASLNVHADSREDIDYAYRSLRVFERIHSIPGMAMAYGILGGMYHWRWAGYERLKNNPAKYDSISFCYKKVEQLGYWLRDTTLIIEGKTRMAGLFMTFKDRRAINDLQWVLDWNNQKRHDTNRVHIMLDLASAYMEFGELKPTYHLLRQAQQLYDDRHFNEYGMLNHLYFVSVVYYQKAGQWQQAFNSLWLYNALNNDQYTVKQDGTIAWLNGEYETENKKVLLKAQNRELALRAENLVIQQRITLAMSALFALATGMSFVFFRLYRKNQRISRQNEELVKEQNHRVKNNLQVVSSLLSLQSKRLADEAAKKAVEESRLRVESMAILHRRLYDGDKFARVNVDEFIRELVGGVLKAYGYYTVETQFIIDDISLSADKAVPLGLILNELTTNACKYAFPNNANPLLSISCRRKNNKIELGVADNGPGLEKTEVDGEIVYSGRNGTFGMQLIQAQVEQLHGVSQFNADAETAFPETVLARTIQSGTRNIGDAAGPPHRRTGLAIRAIQSGTVFTLKFPV